MADLFKLDGDPTFTVTIQIPVPGGAARPLEVEFKWLTAKEFAAKCKAAAGQSDAEFFADLIVRWSADAECSAGTLQRLFDKYQDSARCLFETYKVELTGAERKN